MLKKFPLILAALGALAPLPALAHLQCVPYARSVSGITIHGDAHTWWRQAAGSYQRGGKPQVDAVMVFESSRAMPLGHVAVVREVVDARHVMLDHANWSGPGMIERAALAEDVSEAGDWSAVRVWYAPSHALGARSNPVAGFIYNAPPAMTAPTVLAAADAVVAIPGTPAG